MKTTVVIPVYNEIATIAEILRRVQNAPFEKEILVVDDGSTDGTADYLKSLPREENTRIFFHEKNRGKGAALKTAVSKACGDIVVIQDADLEYYPDEIPLLIQKIEEGKADVVYGSRFIGAHRIFMFYHQLANRVINFIANIFYNTNLTDLISGHKAFRKDVIKELYLTENGFAIEAEITAQIFKRDYRVYEVPISYDGRGYGEGKKIKWCDFFSILFCLIKNRFKPLEIGMETLEKTSKMRNYNQWLFSLMKPYLGEKVVEVGAGIGNFSVMFKDGKRVLVTEYDDYYLARLRHRFIGHPFINIQKLDLSAPLAGQSLPEGVFDSAICSNVMEHVENEKQVIENLKGLLKPGGNLFLLVPAHAALYGELDRELQHYKRYSRPELSRLLQNAGFDVLETYYFNPFAVPGWYFNGRILKRKIIPSFQSRVFDFMVPFLKCLAPKNPPFGLSVIAIARKKETR